MAYYRAVTKSAEFTGSCLGVLLVNLGTPDAPTYFAVQRYLREFLSDRRVINTSRWIWLPLLYGIILPLRPLRTLRKYRKIWMPEGSPLAVYSSRLTEKLATTLRNRLGSDIEVALAMTYGNPSMTAAIEALARRGVRRLVVLPLYPQYCSSTTGSVFDVCTLTLRRWRWLPEVRWVNDYHADEGYIKALIRSIHRHWERVGSRAHLVFSYHGIPAAYVDEGDPYRAQAEATTQLVAAGLGLSEGEFSHCYQSRFGSVVWLQPYTEDTLKELIARGVRQLTVVSPSFAVDCLETLEEVALDYRDKFLALGGERLELVPALNDDDSHAEVLAGVVEKQLGGWVAEDGISRTP